jgi:hypothetical protein
MSQNPFSLGGADIPLCDRQTELQALVRHAHNAQNVLIYGSRRLGKTMLVREVQKNLAQEGYLVVFCDLFGVVSVEDISARICRSLFEVTHKHEPLHKKAIRALSTFRPTMRPSSNGMEFSFSVEKTSSDIGIDVLEHTFSDLSSFLEKSKDTIHIVFDEFQEITEVEKGVQIQGVMRKHIQNMFASFFFVGSRKRTLSQMFHDQSKPFFQSTFDHELRALPKKDCISYIVERFTVGKKSIQEREAELVYRFISGNPYYMQKICYILFDEVNDHVDNQDQVCKAFDSLLDSEKGYFEANFNSLTPKQKSLIKALANERTQNIFAKDYIKKHTIGSIGGIQQSVDTLTKNDFITKENKVWKVVDPVMEAWLRDRVFVF